MDNQLNALKDYSLQIKEMYQNKIDTHQNKIMTVLTVATTIFFPLSIITGWYGMNFTTMPELTWKYGKVNFEKEKILLEKNVDVVNKKRYSK